MSRIVLKTIKIELSTESLDNAIQEVKKFRTQLREICLELVRVLMDEGVVIAKMQIEDMGAVSSGDLENSIHGAFFPGKRCGYVTTNRKYAVFVEYGTGIIGAKNPHPNPPEGWQYDSKGHGEEGWVFKKRKDGKFYWTQGYVSRPFMLNTLRQLEANAPKRMSELVSQM